MQTMLRDRKELLESEIRNLQKEAAHLYLKMVVSGTSSYEDTTRYTKLHELLTDRTFELNNVNFLLSEDKE